MSDDTRSPFRTWLERLWRRLPWPVQSLLQVIVSAAIAPLVIFVLLATFNGLAILGETVVFPRQIDRAWTGQVRVPSQIGDSWVGNVVSDGDRTYVVARQAVRGFWGRLYAWTSNNGGESWSEPAQISRNPWQDAARHTIAVNPQGRVFAAFAEQGPEPATQRLIVSNSVDQGRTWSYGLAVSPTRVGLIGVPAVLPFTDAVIVAYTDGATGEVLVQRLTADGLLDGDPVTLGQTTRYLYSDSSFRDASVSLAHARGHIVAVWTEGESELRAAVSTDGGTTWRPSHGLDLQLYAGRPRLSSDGSSILLAASEQGLAPWELRRPSIRIWRSSDGGETFERGPSFANLLGLSSLDLAWADHEWRLAYDSCPGFIRCATEPRIWYAESADGSSWTDPVVVSKAGDLIALGVVDTSLGPEVAWAEVLGPHAWTFHMATSR